MFRRGRTGRMSAVPSFRAVAKTEHSMCLRRGLGTELSFRLRMPPLQEIRHTGTTRGLFFLRCCRCLRGLVSRSMSGEMAGGPASTHAAAGAAARGRLGFPGYVAASGEDRHERVTHVFLPAATRWEGNSFTRSGEDGSPAGGFRRGSFFEGFAGLRCRPATQDRGSGCIRVFDWGCSGLRGDFHSSGEDGTPPCGGAGEDSFGFFLWGALRCRCVC